MDIPFSPVGNNNNNNIFSACLSPRAADTAYATTATRATHPISHHHGKTRVVTFDMPPTIAEETATATNTATDNNTPSTTPLEAVTKFFSLDNMETFLNCVPLTVDSRSPNSRSVAKGVASLFPFAAVGGNHHPTAANAPTSSVHDETPRQDNNDDIPNQDHFLPRETACELSFMAEREAVLSGGVVMMDDNDIDMCENEGALLRLMQHTAWNLNATAATPKASNHYHRLTEPPPSSSCKMSDELQQHHQEGEMPMPMAMARDVPTSVVVTSMNANGSPSRNDDDTVPMDEPPHCVEESTSSDNIADNRFPIATNDHDHDDDDDAIPGGLWALPSNELSLSVSIDSTLMSDDDDDDVTNAEGQMDVPHRGTRVNDIAVVGGDELMGQQEQEEEEDPVLMMRSSPKASSHHGEGRVESAWAHSNDESPRMDLVPPQRSLDLDFDMKFKTDEDIGAVVDNNSTPVTPKATAAGEDPILAAQRAVSHAMSPNGPNSNRSYNDKYWMDDEDDDQGEDVGEDDDEEEAGEEVPFQVQQEVSDETDRTAEDHYQQEVSSSEESRQFHVDDLMPGEQEEDKIHMAQQDEIKDALLEQEEDDDDSSSYYPNADEIPRLLPLPLSTVNQHEKAATEHRQSPPLKTTRSNNGEEGGQHRKQHEYATDEEANRHFDELFSSFELSLNRRDPERGQEEDDKPVGGTRSIQQQQRPQQGRYNRAHLSPLAAAAYRQKSKSRQQQRHYQNGPKKSSTAPRRQDRSKEEDDDDAMSKSSHASSIRSRSSQFLEGTIMGRKLNHRFTPPASPSSPDAADDDDGASVKNDTVINRARRAVDQANETIETSAAAEEKGAHEEEDKAAAAMPDAKDCPRDDSPRNSRRQDNAVEEYPDDEVQGFSHDIINYNLDEMEFEGSTTRQGQQQGRGREGATEQQSSLRPSSIADRRKKRGGGMTKHLTKFRFASSPRNNATAASMEADEDCPDDEMMGMGLIQQREEVQTNDGTSSDGDANEEEEDNAPTSPKFHDGFLDPSCLEGGRGTASFDSSVNWDAFQYSLSDNMSTNGGTGGLSIAPDRAVVPSTGKEDEDIEYIPAVVSRVPMVTPHAEDTLEDCSDLDEDVPLSSIQRERLGDDDERVDRGASSNVLVDSSITKDKESNSNSSMISYLRRKKVPPSPERHDAVLTPRAWDRIEQIKRRHDEEYGKVRASPKSKYNETSLPSPRHVEEDIIGMNNASPSEEENVAPLSPNATTTNITRARLESMKKQLESNVQHVQFELQSALSPRSSPRRLQELATPRSSQQQQGSTQMETEVQSRINAMRGQHKKNMEKMRHALEDINEDSGGRSDVRHHIASPTRVPPTTPVTKDEKQIAECVGRWKLNAKRFEKAKERAGRWKTTNGTPKHQQESKSPRGHFNFDETAAMETSKQPTQVTSPGRDRDQSIQELMMKNQELEEEMRQIRLLSPKKSTAAEEVLSPASLSPTSLSGNTDLSFGRVSPAVYKSPSARRYTSPRNGNFDERLSSSSFASSPRPQALHTMISDATDQELEMNTRISGLIADVKSFLEENDKAQGQLSEDILALKA